MYQAEILSAHRGWLSAVSLMVGTLIHPKNSPRENAGEKIAPILVWKAVFGKLLFQC